MSNTLKNSTKPTWNEEFTLALKDPANSQLECSLWDESNEGDSTAQKFLGEVILNLAKLVPYNNTHIEQVFEIKQGKTHKATADDKKASGKLKLGLKLIIPDESGSNAPSAPSSGKAPSQPPSQPKHKAAPLKAAPPPKVAAPAPAAAPVADPAPAPPPAPAPAAPPAAPKQNEDNVKPSMVRKARDPDLPKGMVPPVALPGQGKLFVTVHTVQNVPKSDSAYGAPPYPYVIMALEGASRAAQARTVTRDKEDNPTYAEKEFVFGVDNQTAEVAKMHFKLFDWNRGKDQQLASLVLTLADVAAQALEKQSFDMTDPKRGGAQVIGTNGTPTQAVVSLRWQPASGPAPAQATAPPSQRTVAPPPAVTTPKRDGGGVVASGEGAETPGTAPRVLSGNRRPSGPAPSAAPVPQPAAAGGTADVGLVLTADNNTIFVSQIMAAGPAANSKQIRVGDALIDVDGHDVSVALCAPCPDALLPLPVPLAFELALLHGCWR